MQASNNIPEELKTPNYRLTELDGLGRDLRLERQDPSNVIKAGDLFYVWYTQRPANINPYASTIYYSASRDGLKWEDRGQALGKGEKDAWDSFGVITPYMAVINGKYYLYYTATSAEEEKFDYCGTLRHIGVAVSESPDGPWMKYKGNPVLSPSAVAEDYDSLVVDDTHMIVRNEKCWLYFKGRGISRSSEETQWGVAFSDKPTGPLESIFSVPLNWRTLTSDAAHTTRTLSTAQNTEEVFPGGLPNVRKRLRMFGTLYALMLTARRRRSL